MPGLPALLKYYVEGGVPGYEFWCPGCEQVHWFPLAGNVIFDDVNPTVRGSIISEAPGITFCRVRISEGILTYTANSTHSMAGMSSPMILF